MKNLQMLHIEKIGHILLKDKKPIGFYKPYLPAKDEDISEDDISSGRILVCTVTVNPGQLPNHCKLVYFIREIGIAINPNE